MQIEIIKGFERKNFEIQFHVYFFLWEILQSSDWGDLMHWRKITYFRMMTPRTVSSSNRLSYWKLSIWPISTTVSLIFSRDPLTRNPHEQSAILEPSHCSPFAIFAIDTQGRANDFSTKGASIMPRWSQSEDDWVGIAGNIHDICLRAQRKQTPRFSRDVVYREAGIGRISWFSRKSPCHGTEGNGMCLQRAGLYWLDPVCRTPSSYS